MAFLILLFAAGLIAIDQLTKYLAIRYIMPEPTIPLIQIGDRQILNFTYHENTGAAFSIFSEHLPVLIIVTILMLGACVALLFSKKIEGKPMKWILGLIIGGGLGNLIDRIFRGYVVDFIDFRAVHFAVFNFADMCVTVAAILLILYVIWYEGKKSSARGNTAIKAEAVDAALPADEKLEP